MDFYVEERGVGGLKGGFTFCFGGGGGYGIIEIDAVADRRFFFL